MSTQASPSSDAPEAPSAPKQRFDQKLIEGPIAPTLLLFSLPLLGSNVLQSLSSTASAIWISHALGPQALTATVNGQILFMLLMGAVMGVGIAGNIAISQSYGAGDMQNVKRITGTSMTFFFVSSILLGVIGVISAPYILDLMHTPPEARELAIVYLRWTSVVMPIVFVFMFATMMLRGCGDAKTPFYYSALSIVLNLILTPLFLTGVWGMPKLGIEGAVLAGVIANGIGLIGLFVHIYARNNPMALRGEELRYLKPDWTILKMMFLRGLPMGVQMFVLSGASIVMLAMVNDYGADVAAAYGAASQLWVYVQMPAMAIASSVTSMAAQNIGAGRWERVDKLAWVSSWMALGITLITVVAIYLMGDAPLWLFLPEGGAPLAHASHINLYVLWAWAPIALTFTIFGIVRANGAIIPPTIILIISLWLIRVPFAQTLQPVMGMDAIWWSFPLGTIASTLLAIAYYRWGGWRKNRLMMPVHRPTALAPDSAPAGTIDETEVVAQRQP